MNFISDLAGFLKTRKKFWLLPLIIVLVLLCALIFFAGGSARRAVHLYHFLIAPCPTHSISSAFPPITTTAPQPCSRTARSWPAAHEERFTRKKHDPDFPTQAVRYVLEEGAVSLDQVAAVVFYDKPFLKFERLLETYHAFRAARPEKLSDLHAGLDQGKGFHALHA